MPRLVVVSRYLKSGSSKNLSNYVKYIATREGAATVKENNGTALATKKQQELISSLLKDFSYSKNSFSYEEYKNSPTQKNASKFIEETIEHNADIVANKKNYMGYLANRPGAVKFGSHGLFSQTDKPISLQKVAKEVSEHNGNVWTHVVSLRRDDAQKMGYDNLNAWRELIKRQIPNIAKQSKIDMANLKWYAAFHDKETNPHVHIVVYSTNEREGFLTKQGCDKIRSGFMNDIYDDELKNLYQQQTDTRDLLKAESAKLMRELSNEISADCVDNEIVGLMKKLHGQLKNAKGKKLYGYLPTDTKRTVDEIFLRLSQNESIQKMYKLWCDMEQSKHDFYSSAKLDFPAMVDNEHFKSVKNMIIRSAAEIVSVEVVAEEKAAAEDEPDDIAVESDSVSENVGKTAAQPDVGIITTNPAEVLAVLTIFSEYMVGKSLENIAINMKIPYNEDKIWNKNMVKRVLENEKYLGNDTYPQLISEEVFRKVNERKSAKATSLCIIPDDLQEVRNLTVCKKCGKRLFRTKVELWDCRNHECRPFLFKMTDEKPVIIPEEATVIQLIFKLYIDGGSTHTIAQELNNKKYPTRSKSGKWSAMLIKRILQNEKYIGDCLLQKTYTIDCISHKAVKNNGERPMYYVSDCHPAIIDKNTFNIVQQEIARRNAKRSVCTNTFTEQGRYNSKYALTELLICGECGTAYRRCRWTSHNRNRTVWRCINRLEHGPKYCKSPTIDEEPLHNAIVRVINEFYNCSDDVAKVLKSATDTVLSGSNDDGIRQIEQRLKDIDQARNDFVNLIATGTCAPDSLDDEFARLYSEEGKLSQKLLSLKDKANTESTELADEIKADIDKSSFELHQYDDILVRKVIECVKILNKEEISVTFKGGYEIKFELLT